MDVNEGKAMKVDKNIKEQENCPGYQVLAKQLAQFHGQFSERPILRMSDAGEILTRILAVMFPHFSPNTHNSARALSFAMDRLDQDLRRLIMTIPNADGDEAAKASVALMTALPEIAEDCLADAQALLEGDPAADTLDSIILAYPGFYAVAAYRVAHRLDQAGVAILPRLMSEYAHQKTGIEINPAAVVGRSFFIDHGSAVVIGETAIIGDNVKIYQGVTIGAIKVDRGQRNKKRHPTIEDNVVIYSNATILGGDTIVGRNSIIGGNVWITKSVPAGSRIMFKSCDADKMDQLNQSEGLGI